MKNSGLPKLLKTTGRYPYDYYQFEDIDGSYSEKYWTASEYHNGFATVAVTLSGKFQHRDLLGRITEKTTRTGKEFYKFYNEEISHKEIHVICYADKIFCVGVKKELLRRKKAKVKELYEKGIKLSKIDVKKALEIEFAYIDKQHEKACKIMNKKDKKLFAKIKSIKKQDPIQNTKYTKEFQETLEYLNGLSEKE